MKKIKHNPIVCYCIARKFPGYTGAFLYMSKNCANRSYSDIRTLIIDELETIEAVYNKIKKGQGNDGFCMVLYSIQTIFPFFKSYARLKKKIGARLLVMREEDGAYYGDKELVKYYQSWLLTQASCMCNVDQVHCLDK